MNRNKRKKSQDGEKRQIKEKLNEENDLVTSSSNKYLKKVINLKKTVPNWDEIYCIRSDEIRIQQLIRVEVLGKPLCDKYSWAIPDGRALSILSKFSPLIEIGSGKAYWAYLLSKIHQTDIICYDKYKIDNPWYPVLDGGPEVLEQKEVSERNLFLCYPDENESMAVDCLSTYTGDYIIHVGELIISGGTLSSVQSPWGRTSTSEFQVTLMEQFHCVLICKIPTFPFSLDHISVWKRTQTVYGQNSHIDEDQQEIEEEEEAEQNNKNIKTNPKKEENNNRDKNVEDDNNNSNNDDEEEEDEDDDRWNSIPLDERLEFNIAAPAYAHLLS